MSHLTNLNGFAMVFTYTENMLNQKFAQAHYVQGNEHKSKMASRLFPKAVQFEGDYCEWKFQVDKFGAPVLSFDEPHTNSCSLTIGIEEGEFLYHEKIGRHGRINRHVIDIVGQKLILVMPIKHGRFHDCSDSRFYIEAIFADLSQITKATVDFDSSLRASVSRTAKSLLNDKVAAGFADWSKSYLEQHKHYPLILGGTRILKNTGEHALCPTASTFSVTVLRDEMGIYVAGELNLLLQIGSEELPTDQEAGVFHDLLHSSISHTGVLVISSYAISKTVVMPELTRTYSKAHKFLAKHSTTSSQGGVSLGEKVVQHLQYDSEATTERIEGGLVEGRYRIWKNFGVHTWHSTGDIYTRSRGYFDVEFSIDDYGNLKAVQNTLKSTVKHETESTGPVFANINTFEFDEIGRDPKDDERNDRFERIAANMETAIGEVMKSIIVPGGRIGFLNYTGIEVKKAVNGFANMFLTAEFE